MVEEDVMEMMEEVVKHERNKKRKENSALAVGSSESLTHPPLADLVFDLLKKPRSWGRLEETPTDVSGNES